MNDSQITLSEIFLSGGIMGFLTHFLFLVGFVIGLFALIFSIKHNKKKLPLSLKFLFFCALATLFTGACGTVLGYRASFASLAQGGSDQMALFEHGLSIARLVVKVGFVATLLQLFIAMICLLILNINSRKLNIPELSLLAQIKKIPILLYPVIVLIIPVVLGILSSFWSIEFVVKTKPDAPLPFLMKMNTDYLLVIFMLCSIFAIFMLIILFIKMIIKRDKTT